MPTSWTTAPTGNFRDCAYGFFMDFEDVEELFVDMEDSDDEVFLPPLPSLPVNDLLVVR